MHLLLSLLRLDRSFSIVGFLYGTSGRTLPRNLLHRTHADGLLSDAWTVETYLRMNLCLPRKLKSGYVASVRFTSPRTIGRMKHITMFSVSSLILGSVSVTRGATSTSGVTRPLPISSTACHPKLTQLGLSTEGHQISIGNWNSTQLAVLSTVLLLKRTHQKRSHLSWLRSSGH